MIASMADARSRRRSASESPCSSAMRSRISKLNHGQATLVAGTKVVNTAPATFVTANTRIFLGVHTPGGTPGWLQVSARSAGTSFTILSSSGTDTSVVDYWMVEP